jgi:preprotein translocase subunit YajC
MGNVESLAAATKSASGGSSLYLLIGVVAIVALMYFMMIRPQRNRQRQIMQAQSGIAPGTQVRTTAGMYATVVAIEDGDVVLEVAPGVNIRYMRRAIMDVVPPETGAGGADQTMGATGVAEDAAPSEAGTAGTAESGSAAE